MDKNATKYKSVDEYDDSTNASVEKETSESTATEQKDTEQTEMNMTSSVTNTNGPDNMSFQTEVPRSSASEQADVETAYLQQQGSFQLPPYEAAIHIQPIQENHSGGGKKKNKNENIRLTETSDTGPTFQPTHLERPPYEETQRRVNSFFQHQVPQADALAEAGFYFADNGVIRCFACGIEFRDWTEQDNIWEWHARWSTFCSHVETEGKKYFDLQYLDLKIKKKQVKLIRINLFNINLYY